ncbi:MAG TPA: hopanoid biosynthesis-associated protein HpnK [Candidatus Binataceae bacterium]
MAAELEPADRTHHNCPAVKAAIINADDFGMSPEANAGIIRSHRDGVVTSASLMVASPAAEQAAALAKDFPTLDVGLHAVVCQGYSVLPPDRLGGLVDSRRAFTDNPAAGGIRYFLSRRLRARLADELRAQVDRHLALIGYLNHIDGHLNFHVHPVLADILVRLAVEYRVPFIRLPREPLMPTLATARDHLARKLIESVVFRSLCARAAGKLREHNIKTTDRLFGLYQSGHQTESWLMRIVENLPDGLCEFYFHPAIALPDRPPPPADRVLECSILCSPALRSALERKRVALTTFAAVNSLPCPNLGRG